MAKKTIDGKKYLVTFKLDKMTPQEKTDWFANRIYGVAALAETIEHSGRFLGNGHHFAQKLTAIARAMMEHRLDMKTKEKMVDAVLKILK